MSELNTMIQEALASDFMLADISISSWDGRVSDRQAATRLTVAEGAATGSARVTKDLFPNGTGAELRAILKLLGSVRTDHYGLTLPWSVEGLTEEGRQGRRTGSRLLPTAKVFDHARVVGTAKKQLDSMLRELEVVYDQRVREALSQLGRLGDPDAYPTFDNLKDRFAVDTRYEPIPDPEDFRRGSAHLPPQAVERLVEKLRSAQTVMVGNAVSDLWERAVSAVQHMAERFADDEEGGSKRLFDSVQANVLTLAGQLRSFKVAESPEVEAICARIESELGEHDMKAIRKDDSIRRKLSQAAARIAASMEALENVQ